MPVVTASSKGQIVLPAKIRKKLGIKKGTRLSVEEKAGKITVVPVARDPITEGWGMLKDAPGLLEDLLQERRADYEREEKKFGSR